MNRQRIIAAIVVVAALVPIVWMAFIANDALGDNTDQGAHTAPTTTAAPAPAVSEDCRGYAPTDSYPPLAALPAPKQMPSGSKMEEIQNKGVLTVGVSADTILFGAQNPFTNEIEGFDVDMLRLVAKAIFGPDGGDKLEFKVITYAQRIPSLQDRSVDLVAHTMTINCRRWNQIGFSATYYDAGQRILVRNDADADTQTIDTLDAAGARVCAPEGSTNIDNLDPYANIVKVGVVDITDCLVLFQQGKVDAITADDTVLAGFADQDPYAKVVGPLFTQEPYGIGANADDVDLIQFVNKVLADAKANGQWKQIRDRWLGTDDSVVPPVVSPPYRDLP